MAWLYLAAIWQNRELHQSLVREDGVSLDRQTSGKAAACDQTIDPDRRGSHGQSASRELRRPAALAVGTSHPRRGSVVLCECHLRPMRSVGLIREQRPHCHHRASGGLDRSVLRPCRNIRGAVLEVPCSPWRKPASPSSNCGRSRRMPLRDASMKAGASGSLKRPTVHAMKSRNRTFVMSGNGNEDFRPSV